MSRRLSAHRPAAAGFKERPGSAHLRATRFAIGVLLAACLALPGCGKKEQAAPQSGPKKVKLVTLGSTALLRGKDFPGRAEASSIAEMSFRVSGPLLEFPAKQGAVVELGALLAKIDPRDFETQAKTTASQLEQANVEMKRMKAGARPEDIRRLEANQQARTSEFKEVQTRLNRYKTLLVEKVVAQQEFDQVKASYDVAQANLEKADQELVVGRKGAREEDIQEQQAKIAGLEAQLRAAQDAVKDTALRAPFSGVVARTYVKNFEDVLAKQPILSIQDISRIDVKIYVPESDLGRGLKGRAIHDAAKTLEAEAAFGSLSGRVFPLKVKEYQTEADPKTQTFEIVLQMENPPDHPVMPGMNATVRTRKVAASGPTGGEGFMVPVEAVFADAEGKQHVWIVDSGTQCVSRRAVKTDQIAEGQIRVTEGLNTGETIVASAANMLSEGMKVAQMADLRGL